MTDKPTIYLAGKIDKSDWRHDLVPGLRNAVRDWELSDSGYAALDKRIPITDHVDYIGPFFVGCDHGCCHGDDMHGVMGGCVVTGSGAGPDTGRVVEMYTHTHDCHCGDCHDPSVIDLDTRSHVASKCLEQIKKSNAVVALIEDDAHGTLVEVGYAIGIGRTVMAVNDVDCVGEHLGGACEDYFVTQAAWFPFHAPGVIRWCCVRSAIDALSFTASRRNEETLCESPVELAFLRAMRRHGELSRFRPNVKVMDGRYRIDFADPTNLIGIEIDGHQFHSDKETFAKDRVRQRELEKAGWRIVRYSGQEVHRDADSCVADLRTWLAATA